MTQSRRGWAIAVALTILGLIATACQQGTPGTSQAPSGAQADPNGVFNENLGTEADSTDPQVESFVQEINISQKVFDPMMTFDPKTGQVLPLSAKEMPKLSSDGLTYTFTIKDGLKYSDGQPVTAKNFEYGFKRLCDPTVAGEYAFTGYIVAGCEKYSSADAKATSPADLQKLRDAVGVKATDDKTITYTLTEKAPYFLSIMALWVGAPTREDMVTKGATSPYCTFYQGYNTTKPPFDDANVRLAFSKAFDRQQYVEDILSGIGTVNMSFMPPGLPAYDNTDETQKFDAAAAKQLLSSSKYAADLTSGKLKVSMGFSSTQLNLTRAQWFQGQYKQNLGVTIDLDAQDSTTYTKNVKALATTPQMFRLGWCMDYPDPQDWLTTVFHSSSTVSHTGWKNDQFDTLVRQADAEPDAAKRESQYKQAQKILTKDAPAGFVYTNAAWTLVKPWVQGWNLTPLDSYFSQLAQYNMVITTAKPK